MSPRDRVGSFEQEQLSFRSELARQRIGGVQQLVETDGASAVIDGGEPVACALESLADVEQMSSEPR